MKPERAILLLIQGISEDWKTNLNDLLSILKTGIR